MSEQITFQPSPYQRRLKAKFLVQLKKQGIDQHTWTKAAVESVLGQDLSRQWSKPGFAEWMTDLDEFQVECELAAQDALQAAREIVANPEEKGQARVTAAKIIFNIAGKEPKRVIEKYADGNIAKLAENPEQLKQFILDAAKRALSPEELKQLAEDTKAH